MLDLVPLWAGILGLAVLMYVLLDGFDLGVGILFLLRKQEADRNLMIGSVGPIWDFNETWLVLGGAGLLAAFPLAFSIIIPAVYFPILVMLLGLLFRGVAFEFREIEGARRALWNAGFGYGSIIASFAQGVVLGCFVRGFHIVGRSFAGSSWDWISPFPLLTGAGLVVGYMLLGATWLVMKTEGELQEWARKKARLGLVGVIAFVLMISIWTPLANARIEDRWFSFPNILFFAPVPILTAGLAWLLGDSLRKKRDALPFLCAMGIFFLGFTGLIISIWPYVALPSVTLWDAAAAPMSQEFLMVGTLFLLPIILLYVFWSYWLFRGKVRHGGYH